MIDARELRIGNFLLFEDNSVIEVRGIHPSGKYIHNGKQWIELFRCNHIFLTDEELFKFGFRLNIDVWEFPNYLANAWIQLLSGSYFLGVESHWMGCEIESVHQLQNLYFALTGTELTIK